MEKITTICDLCRADGFDKEAVAQYWDTENKRWDVCLMHLKAAKNAGLYFEMLNEERD